MFCSTKGALGGDTVARDKKENAEKPTSRYAWDPEKLAWVESMETPSEEAQIEEVSGEEETQVTEGIPAEGALDEVVVAESALTGVTLTYQGAFLRAGGALIDLIILAIGSLIIEATVGRVINGMPGYMYPIYALLYFVGFWLWRGQTPGQIVVNAKVVKADGGAVDVGRAFLRYLFYLLPIYGPIPFLTTAVSPAFSILLPVICLGVMAFTKQKRGIHDFLAGTVVIKRRFEITPVEDIVGAQEEQNSQSGSDTVE